MFHGDTEKYYTDFFGLLHKNLLSQNLEGDITVTNILFPEISDHLLAHMQLRKWHRS